MTSITVTLFPSSSSSSPSDDDFSTVSLLAGSETHLWQSGAPTPCFTATATRRSWTATLPLDDDDAHDAWLVVSAARGLSRSLAPRVAAVSVRESQDGELVLVEAADVLPEWLEPDTAVNRVFFRAGRLHIVPPSVVEDAGDVFKVVQALDEARTLASPIVERAVTAKLEPYPALALTHSTHFANVEVHDTLARVVASVPELVPLACALLVRSNASGGYFDHHHHDDDDDDEEEEQKWTRDGPTHLVRLRFTRLAYARLAHVTQGDFSASALGNKLARGFALLHRKAHEDLASDLASYLAANYEPHATQQPSWPAFTATLSSATLNHRLATMLSVVGDPSAFALPVASSPDRPNDADGWLFEEPEPLQRVAEPPPATAPAPTQDQPVALDPDAFFRLLQGFEGGAYEAGAFASEPGLEPEHAAAASRAEEDEADVDDETLMKLLASLGKATLSGGGDGDNDNDDVTRTR